VNETHPDARARTRVVAGLLLFSLVAVACGQKPGVHQEIAVGIGSGGDFVAGEEDFDPGTLTDPDGLLDPDSTSLDGGTQGGSSGGGGTSGAGSTGGGTTATTAPTGGGGGGGGGGSATPSGTDRTGVTADSLTVAVHAPVTGAAPLPVTSFEEAADLYWRWQIEEKQNPILGRTKVNVVFKDDKYQPSTAVQACRELAASAFLLVGGGGTDQIQACGRFAEQARVPYLSAGVTEAGLRGLQWYFATSMSYAQQGPVLAQFVKKTFPSKKVAMIVTDTPNFDDAVQGWESGVASQGIDYYKTLKHTKGDTSWINSFGSELRSNGVEVVYILTAPVDYIRFAQQNSGDFQYVGVGISMGLNAVLGSGCPHVDGGIFFSPAPGLDWVRENEPDFFASAQKFNAPADDIGYLLWGNAKVQHEMFKRYAGVYGNDLTREDFRAVLEQQQNLTTKTFPPLSYSPQDHFGGSQIQVLQGNCGAEEYQTLETFKSGF